MLDRSSAPVTVANRTDERTIEAIAALRRLRFTGPEIAELLDRPLSTVSGILTRIGMGRLGRLGLEPAERYERDRPGELIHIDVKKLGRIARGPGNASWAARAATPAATAAPASADAARLGLRARRHRRLHPPGLRRSPARRESHHRDRVPARAVAFYRRHGITVEQLITDNGSAYRSTIHAIACRALGIRHLRTRPYRPQTNGKAERFIRTMLGGWAYGAIYALTAENAPQPLTAGSGPTTIADDTQPSAANHPSTA